MLLRGAAATASRMMDCSPVKYSAKSCSNFMALSNVFLACSSDIRLFISMMLSTDIGRKKMAIGCSWATWRRLIALPLTSRMQCLPWRKNKTEIEVQMTAEITLRGGWSNFSEFYELSPCTKRNVRVEKKTGR